MSATTAPALVAMKTDDGFRVHQPGEPGSIGVVTGSNSDPRCTCGDFQADPRRACRHIEAVRPMLRDREPGEDPSDDDPMFAGAGDPAREFANGNGHANGASDRAIHSNGVHPARDHANGNGVGTLVALAPATPTMTIKRSVSPDGRIDSLSIEFTAPVPGTASEIQTRALRVLSIQDEIADAFLREHAPCDDANGGGDDRSNNGNGNGQGSSDNGRNGSEAANDGAVSATLVEISAMQTSVGFSHYLVLNVQGEDKEVRLFGKKNELGQALNDAGAGRFSNRIEKGVRLGVPCRVILDRSGRYPRVDRLLPASGDGGGNGSNGNGANNGGSRNGYGSRGSYGSGNGRGGYRR